MKQSLRSLVMKWWRFVELFWRPTSRRHHHGSSTKFEMEYGVVWSSPSSPSWPPTSEVTVFAHRHRVQGGDRAASWKLGIPLPPFPICLELEQVSFPGNDEEEWMRQGETFPDSVSVDAFPPLKSVYTHTYVSLLTNFFPFFNLEHGADRVVPHRGGGSGSRRTIQWQVQILCILKFTYKVQIQKIIH